MLDLTNYNVDVKRPITQAEYEERIEKGLIRSGEEIEVIENSGKVAIYVTIPPPKSVEKEVKNSGNDTELWHL